MSDNYLLKILKDSSNNCSFSIINKGKNEFLIRKLVTTYDFTGSLHLFSGKVAAPDDKLYAEGFQMLSQTGGTFKNIENIGRCPDDEPPYSHKNRNPEYKEAYNFIIFKHDGLWHLLGFTSCEHYTGLFKIFRDGSLQIDLLTEGKEFKCGDVIESEYFTILEGTNKAQVLKEFASLINTHHTPLKFDHTPTGWCSWYCYYANLTEHAVYTNLDEMKEHDNLEYVQLDDGYQTHMGDWLNFTDKFPSGFERVVSDILKAGKKPALWLAPFIASENSELFKQHPDWFATALDGNLVSADKITYGGWRDLNWYPLDFSKAEAVAYIQNVFSYFHDKLNIKYFKLDACYWGAINGYKFASGNSRIDNYREGLKAILSVVGKDSFVLGCNAPIWPSLGLVHAMRVSDDIQRTRFWIEHDAKETFSRQWMNRELWINDPDCLCLRNFENQIATEEDFNFHLCAILVSDGVLMLGDSLKELEPKDFNRIDKIIEIQKWDKSITYDDDFTHFVIKDNNSSRKIDVFFNWINQPISVKANGNDLFTDLPLDEKEITIAPFSAKAVLSE